MEQFPSAGYMPSEQSKGHPKFCSDIHAVGMVCIEALTGVLPEELPTDSALEVIWRDRVSVSPKLAAILDKMVRYHFKERYPSASEVLADITPPPKTPKFLWLAGIALAIAAIAGIVIPKLIPQPVISPSPPNPKPSPTDKIIW